MSLIIDKIEHYHENGSLSDKEYLDLLIKVHNAERQARFFDNLEAKLEPLDMGKLEYDMVYIGDKLYDIVNFMNGFRRGDKGNGEYFKGESHSIEFLNQVKGEWNDEFLDYPLSEFLYIILGVD